MRELLKNKRHLFTSAGEFAVWDLEPRILRLSSAFSLDLFLSVCEEING